MLCASTGLLGRPTDSTDPLLFVDLLSERLSNIITLQVLENLPSTRGNFKISKNETKLKQSAIGPGEDSPLCFIHREAQLAYYSVGFCVKSMYLPWPNRITHRFMFSKQ